MPKCSIQGNAAGGRRMQFPMAEKLGHPWRPANADCEWRVWFFAS